MNTENNNDLREVEIIKEPTELYKILKFEGMVPSGGEAKQVIANELVTLNGKVETQKRKKIMAGDVIEFNDEKILITLLTNKEDDLKVTVTENLKPEEYQAVIGPSLHAAADVAAARGDPDLFNDLPSMIALMTLTRDLADLYQHHWGALGQISPADVFEAAPSAACVIVLQEQKLDQESVVAMSQALDEANTMLRKDNMLGQERVEVQKAWDASLDKNTELAHTHLKQAARTVTNIIDTWEVKRRVKQEQENNHE